MICLHYTPYITSFKKLQQKTSLQSSWSEMKEYSNGAWTRRASGMIAGLWSGLLLLRTRRLEFSLRLRFFLSLLLERFPFRRGGCLGFAPLALAAAPSRCMLLSPAGSSPAAAAWSLLLVVGSLLDGMVEIISLTSTCLLYNLSTSTCIVPCPPKLCRHRCPPFEF